MVEQLADRDLVRGRERELRQVLVHGVVERELSGRASCRIATVVNRLPSEPMLNFVSVVFGVYPARARHGTVYGGAVKDS